MSLDPGLAAKLRELGPTLDLAAVHALYEPLLARQSRASVVVEANHAYGAHGRHRLDLYLPESEGPHPVFVWFHGGGFVRGDKQHRANIGYWGAREGFVSVHPNYRLAPESRWPSGAEDVIAVWSWLRAHVTQFGGDPERIVLAGESAGAAHVAAATLMRRFQPADFHVAGTILLSGPYDAALEGRARKQFGIATPDPRNEAYFGSDPRGWEAASIVDHVDVPPHPLWIGFAERDLLQMQVQACALFARLVQRHGFAPELTMLRDHNHFSSGYSIGTEDQTVSAVFVDFVRRCCQGVSAFAG
jgi:acetyl esterase/lipase